VQRETASQAAHSENEASGARASAASLARAPFTILYVEDNATNFLLVERVFASEPDIELLHASSAHEGVQLAASRRPDLILLDLHLPDGRGDEVLTRLRAEPATRRIPVVAITADARREQRDRLLAAGVDAYLTKPITISRLLNLVADLRNGRA
jgi:CheY-like chemotaxis protein